MAFRSRLKSHGGCANCKKRRKKCDEEKPVCGACRRHLLHCSWTSPKRSEVQTHSARHTSPDYELVARYFEQKQTVPKAIDLSAYQGQVCAAQTLELCFQGANNPFDPVNTDNNGGTIQSTFSFAPPENSLARDCFVALSLLVVGHRYQDANLIQAGRLHHGKSLNKVRESIYDEDKRYNLDTLAAVCQLGITSTMMPWFTCGNMIDSSEGIFHGAGLMNIFEKMQPEWFQTTHALAFFEYVRGGLLLLALTTQRKTHIVSEAWKTIPWAHAKHTKNEWQRLLDFFCELAVIESEVRLGSTEKDDHRGDGYMSISERISDLVLRLSEWRQSIDPGLKTHFSASDQAANLDNVSRSGLASWQSQRFFDLGNLATFNLMLIYLCGMLAAIPPTTSRPQAQAQAQTQAQAQAQTANVPSSPISQKTPTSDRLIVQLTPLTLPLDNPIQRAKIAARECFGVWNCAAKDGFYSIRILHLIGPLMVAEHFLARVGEKVVFTAEELLNQMHMRRRSST